MAQRALTTDDLLFVSFNSRVFAVDRTDGSVVWKWKARHGGVASAVSMLPSGDRLFVSSNGYTGALDPCNGEELWYQPFKGEGTGIPMLATMRGASDETGAATAAAAQQAAIAMTVATSAAVAASAS